MEHRLFSHITMNWRGRPLTSHDVIISSIAATTTRAGLTVQARLDHGSYPTGVKLSNAQMAALPISRHPFHGEPVPVQRQHRVHPGGDHEMQARAGIAQHVGQTVQDRRFGQQMEVVEDQHHG